MRKIYQASLVFATALAFAPSASHAGAITSLVPSEINLLEDDDYETYFDRGNDPTLLKVGDQFLGTIKIPAMYAPVANQVYAAGLTDQLLTAVFAVEVARVDTTTDPTKAFVYYKPIGTTDWNSTFGLAAGTIPDASSVSTMIQVWDDVVNNTISVLEGNLGDSLATFIGANKVYEFGFKGALGAMGVTDGVTDQGEFWIANGDAGSEMVGMELDSITNLLNLNVIGQFNGAPDLDQHTWLSGGANQAAAVEAGASFAVAAQLQAQGGIDDTQGAGGDFDFKTDTNIYIQPIVPEPSSMVLLAWGSLTMIGVRYRRRRKSQMPLGEVSA